jgi:multifunctional beta-oxidation protein
VKEIIDNGGKAVANYNNVVDGDKIVESAMKAFGRCDIVINNAGILRDKSFIKLTKEDWRSVMDVHLEGTFNMCHAAWPIMQQQKHGRIINVGSGAGLYGNFGQSSYSAAKMAILGLTNTLAIEGVILVMSCNVAMFNLFYLHFIHPPTNTQEKHDIRVNCVVPVAGSRMTETVLSPEMLKLLDPQHIVPIVAYLSHESTEATGSCFEVGGGWYSQVRVFNVYLFLVE